MTQPIARLILTHGAGAGCDSDFIQQLSAALQRQQIEVCLFEFGYMRQMKLANKRRPPPKMPTLIDELQQMVEQQQSDLPLFVGGKSMGGRVATMLRAQPNVAGVIAYGYPFHPPGKPDKLRTEHLVERDVATLIVQGERDTFGSQQEIAGYDLDKSIALTYLAAADHSLKPLRASGISPQQHIDTAAKISADFIRSQLCI